LKILISKSGEWNMEKEESYLADVGMRGMPFPLQVLSRQNENGQHTIANISVQARVDSKYESGWIDRFIKITHRLSENTGMKNLNENIAQKLKELNAAMVRVDFDYPFFVRKSLPVTKENCLVRYMCTFTAKTTSIGNLPKTIFKIHIPAITTDPASDPTKEGGLYGQLSVISIEVDSRIDIYPEDLVTLVDKYSISPVYSYLNPEDEIYIIQRAHSLEKQSEVLTEELKSELANDRFIDWFSVKCRDFGMLHSYNTVIGTEKDLWMPFQNVDE